MTTTKPNWHELMKTALQISENLVASEGDVPVAALLVDAQGNVVATGHNLKEAQYDPTAHAEIVAIRQAAAQKRDWHLEDLTLVVTLEPCVMCAGAIVAARIPRVVFGAWDDRVGASGSLYDLLRDSRLGKPVEVIAGVEADACSQQLRQFFEARRTSGSK
jgi:tRNA(adenine34) deaminase